MERYCTNCKKSFDFTIKSIYDLDSLVCPLCGRKIDKNSRKPVVHTDIDGKIGSVFQKLFAFFYVFYISCAVIGGIAYFFNLNLLLYIMTGISLLAYVIQLFAGFMEFKSGLFFLPLGAIAGYLFARTAEGACLGIHIIFAIRHIIRDIILRIIFFFINKAQ
ncbi:MAG: hypothetical protein K5930_12470 [Treponemataceae bacterium]|nr:hypothetical protein [Treponemataceae bacterium]